MNLAQALGREAVGALGRSWEGYLNGSPLEKWASARELALHSDVETKVLRILGRRALTRYQVCLRLNSGLRDRAERSLADLVKRGVVEKFYERVGKCKWWYRVKRQTEGACGA